MPCLDEDRRRGLKSFQGITDGRADDLPEQALLYVGDIEEVRAKAKAM